MNILREVKFESFVSNLTGSDIISLIYDSATLCGADKASNQVIAIDIRTGDISLKLFNEMENNEDYTAIFCKINIADVLKKHLSANSFKNGWGELYTKKGVSLNTLNTLTDMAEVWLENNAYAEYKSKLLAARKK